jgi:hypothetical protein
MNIEADNFIFNEILKVGKYTEQDNAIFAEEKQDEARHEEHDCHTSPEDGCMCEEW